MCNEKGRCGGVDTSISDDTSGVIQEWSGHARRPIDATINKPSIYIRTRRAVGLTKTLVRRYVPQGSLR